MSHQVSPCGAAANALASTLTALSSSIEFTPPALAEDKRVAVCIGAQDGLLISISEGSLLIESWHGSRPEATTTVHIDGVDTLQKVLVDEKAAPVMLLRRKIRLEGNLAWLEQLRSLAPAQAAQPETMRALAAEVAATIGSAIERVPTQSSFSSILWVPDEAASDCMRCGVRFTRFRRRHHCRSCGRLMCSACAPLLSEAGTSSNCFSAFGSRSSNPGRVRTCAECANGGSARSFVGGIPSSASFTSSMPGSFCTPATVGGGGGNSFSIQNEELNAQLKGELDELRKERQERMEKQVREGVAQIWFLTYSLIVGFTALLFWWRLSALVAYLLFMVVLRRFPSSSLARYAYVFWAFNVVASKLYITRTRIRAAGLKGDAKEAEWLECHRLVARFMFERICLLGGFWVKIGQSASVNVAFPLPYQDEFKKLQDQNPPSPIEDVMMTLREEFGPEAASSIKLDPDLAPLGVASIGQVHKAVWRPSGSTATQTIAVKVQHRGADKTFRQDLFSARLMSIFVAKVDPEGVPDMRPIIAKMREVTLNELDFRLEAANTQRAAKTVKEIGIDVFIATVIPDLVARRAMAMEYVDGVGLNSLDQLPNVNSERLVASLVDHYAVQFTIDGHFNADPHPGNLMVKRDSGQLVVLDWGMCISLQPKISDAFAQIFFASATSNLWALVDALKTIGLNFKEGDVFEPYFFMIVMRFTVRDSQPMMIAQEEVGNFMKSGNDAYQTMPKRYHKSPVDVFTGDMLYFGKALTLLYNVSSKLNVNHPTLQTLFRRAYAKLLGRHHETSLPHSPHEFLPVLNQSLPSPRSAVDHDLQKLLREFYRQGFLLGAQVCLTDLGAQQGHNKWFGSPRVLADFAVGVRGWLELDLVTPETLFNLLDISKLLISIVLLRLIDKGTLKLDDCLSKHWPCFGKNHCGSEKSDVTVEHVLGHTAGLWNLMPDKVHKIEDFLDFEKMLAAVGSESCLEPAGNAQRYHYISFGYLCAGICRYLAKREISELWTELVARVSTQSHGVMKPQDLLLRVTPEIAAHRAQSLIHKGISSVDLNEIGALLERMTTLFQDNRSSEAEDAVEKCASRVFGREHLVDLSLFTRAKDVPCSLLPGLQAFGTARSLATLMNAVAGGSELLSPQMIDNMTKTRQPSATGGDSSEQNLGNRFKHLLRLDAFKEWGLGMQLVRPEQWDGQINPSEAKPAWGHLSQSGSAALVLPGKHPKVLAILLNMVDSSEAHRITWAVLRMLEKHHAVDGSTNQKQATVGVPDSIMAA